MIWIFLRNLRKFHFFQQLVWFVWLCSNVQTVRLLHHWRTTGYLVIKLAKASQLGMPWGTSRTPAYRIIEQKIFFLKLHNRCYLDKHSGLLFLKRFPTQIGTKVIHSKYYKLGRCSAQPYAWADKNVLVSGRLAFTSSKA